MCKILVVDDAPDYREMLRGILSDEGYAVRVATNEGEALDAVIHESFDFALVDVRLHDGGEDDESGSSLAMAFRALDPQIRVILLTRYVKAEQIVRAIRYLGVVDFIEKAPDVRERILKIIAKPQKARNETVSIQPVIATVEKSISERPYLIKLRRILAERFDAGELRTLCFDLGVDYGNLPGESKADKARELVAYLERRDRIYKLAQVGRKHRSDIPWDDILEETRQATEKFDTVGNVTQLSLALAENRSLTIRARGHYVYSEETPKILQVNIKRYVRKTDLARKDIDNLRFHIGEIGFDLWREIFTEHAEVERAYIEARAKSQSLLLLFETCREFLQLPIEFLRSETPPEYLVLQHPLARFLRNAIPKREAISPHMLALTDKLRVLIIASNTVPLIDGVDVETQKLANYLRHQDCIPVDVELVPTEHATYQYVKERLKEQSYDIVHYAGHGSYQTESPEESSLYFWTKENKQGKVVPMQAAELKTLLGQAEARLVYLSSCYGTASGDDAALLDDDFLGLADAVVQAGVPSVLGFRWPVSDDGARKLALAFYRSLLEQGSPEIALWSARCELSIDRNDTTWLSPILIHQV